MSEGTRSAEPVAPIRHRLAVRPVLVSLSAKPKFPRRLDKNDNVVRDDGCKRGAKHGPNKNRSKRDKRKAQAEKGVVEPPKRDSHILVQIPNGPLVKVPVGAPYCCIQHGKYKYSLLVDPATGNLLHVHKRVRVT